MGRCFSASIARSLNRSARQTNSHRANRSKFGLPTMKRSCIGSLSSKSTLRELPRQGSRPQPGLRQPGQAVKAPGPHSSTPHAERAGLMRTLPGEKKISQRWRFHRLLLLILSLLLLAGCGSAPLVSAAPTPPFIAWPDGWYVLRSFSNATPKIGISVNVTPTTTWRVMASCSGKGTLSILRDRALLQMADCPQPRPFSTPDQPPPGKQIDICADADAGVFYQILIIEKNIEGTPSPGASPTAGVL
jgi:hypothetical protein